MGSWPDVPTTNARGDDREGEFAKDPKSQAERWKFEMDASYKEISKWHKEGEQIVKRYLDERPSTGSEFPRDNQTRWNIFTRNVQMQKDLVFGKTPVVTVTRKFGDPNDDAARVAGMLLERVLNCEIERESDGFNTSVSAAYDDYMIAGFACVKLRYEAGFGVRRGKPQLVSSNGRSVAPAIPDRTVKADEDVKTDYLYWKDVRWNSSRTFNDFRWMGFQKEMTRRELIGRFGKEIGSKVPLNAAKAKKNPEVDAQKMEPWARAKVWEMWDKVNGKVDWWVDGFDRILDSKPDYYRLFNFWPCPTPLIANATTSKFIPVPDFRLAKDLYDEIDALSTKITAITRVLKVAAAYDKSLGDDLKKLVNEAGLNEMIPVANWPKWQEKGGLEGSIDWFPFEAVIVVLDKLSDKRSELVQVVYQMTGYSDLMRGEQMENGTPGEAYVKAKFASMRLQANQDRFAQFVSRAQRIRAELICKFYDTRTILERSNAQYTFEANDVQLLGQAVQLLRDKFWMYRIEVKPENVALTDFGKMQGERMQLMTGLAQFFAGVQPIVTLIPQSTPLVLSMLKYYIVGFPGSTEVESELDRAMSTAMRMLKAQAQQPQAAQPPDPKMIAATIKTQGDLAKIDKQTQADMMLQKTETEEVKVRKEHEVMANIVEEKAKAAIHGRETGNPDTAPTGA